MMKIKLASLTVACDSLWQEFAQKVCGLKILLGSCIEGICSAKLQTGRFGIFSTSVNFFPFADHFSEPGNLPITQTETPRRFSRSAVASPVGPPVRMLKAGAH